MRFIRAILNYFKSSTAREDKTEHCQEEEPEKIYDDADTLYDLPVYYDYEFEVLKDKYRL